MGKGELVDRQDNGRDVEASLGDFHKVEQCWAGSAGSAGLARSYGGTEAEPPSMRPISS